MAIDPISIFPKLDIVTNAFADRYDVIKSIRRSRYSETFLGTYKASNIPVLIEIYNNKKSIEEVDAWNKCSQISLTLETILEKGSIGQNLFFTVSAFPASEDLMPLSQIGNLNLQQIMSIGIQLCEIIQVLHDNEIYYLVLDPTRIIVKHSDDNIEIISLRKKTLNYELGYVLEKKYHEDEITYSRDKSELERLYLETETPSFLDNVDKRFTQLTGWQYSVLNPFIAPAVCLGVFNSDADIYSVIMILHWLITKKYQIDIDKIADNIYPQPSALSEDIRSAIFLNKILETVFGAKFITNFEGIPPEAKLFLQTDNEGYPQKRRFIDTLKKAIDEISQNKLQVSVKNAKGRPIKNIQVHIRNISYASLNEIYSGPTGPDGIVTFSGICSGTYKASIKNDAFYPLKDEAVTVDNGEMKTCRLTLKQLSFADWLKKKYSRISERKE